MHRDDSPQQALKRGVIGPDSPSPGTRIRSLWSSESERIGADPATGFDPADLARGFGTGREPGRDGIRVDAGGVPSGGRAGCICPPLLATPSRARAGR